MRPTRNRDIIMKRIVVAALCLLSLYSFAQLQGSFQYGQDGHIYFYLHNPTPYSISVNWGVNNSQTGESRQNFGVMSPNGTFIYGPNNRWIWMENETFTVTYSNGESVYWTCPQTDPTVKPSNTNFKGGENSDGYIPKGKIRLRRTISGLYDTFDLYNKRGINYVRFKGVYYKISGSGTITIDNIKYDKP